MRKKTVIQRDPNCHFLFDVFLFCSDVLFWSDMYDGANSDLFILNFEVCEHAQRVLVKCSTRWFVRGWFGKNR